MGGDLLSAQADVDRLAWPDEWGAQHRVSAWAVALGLGAAVLVAVALVLTQGFDDPRVLVGAVLAPALAGLAALVVQTKARRRRASTTDVRLTATGEAHGPAVVLPYRRDVAALRLFVTGWIAFVASVLVVGGVVLATTTEPASAGLGAALLGALLLAPTLVAVLRRRLRRGAVVLTPDRLVHRSWAADTEVPWADVLAVVPGGERDNHVLVTAASRSGATPEPGSARTRAWRRTESRLAPHLSIAVADVAVDPVLLLHTLRHYAAHPEVRQELGTEAAVDRIRRGDVVG